MPAQTVDLYCDGKLVGSATSNATLSTLQTVTITTKAGVTFSDGSHVFTATQVAQGTVSGVPNDSNTYRLTSAASKGLTVIIASEPVNTVDLPTTATQFSAEKRRQRAVDQRHQRRRPAEQAAQRDVGGGGRGAADEADQLTINYAYGGVFDFPLE